MPLNSKEILIIGGTQHIFDTKTNKIRMHENAKHMPSIQPKYFPCIRSEECVITCDYNTMKFYELSNDLAEIRKCFDLVSL